MPLSGVQTLGNTPELIIFHLNWDIYKFDYSEYTSICHSVMSLADFCILQQLKEKKYINGTKGNEVRNAVKCSANDS